jgi:hypothetical protein
VLHADKGSAQVDVEDAVPLVEFDLGKRRRLVFNTGVVEGDVQSAERLDSARDRRLNPLGHRYVAGDDQHLPTGILDRICGLPQRILCAVDDGDASAFGGERDSGGAPDAAGSAGNEGDLARKTIGTGHSVTSMGLWVRGSP